MLPTRNDPRSEPIRVCVTQAGRSVNSLWPEGGRGGSKEPGRPPKNDGHFGEKPLVEGDYRGKQRIPERLFLDGRLASHEEEDHLMAGSGLREIF